MKKLFFTFSFAFSFLLSNAQDITITFQSKFDTVAIDSLNATNLRTNQTVKLLGGEKLLLVNTSTSINQLSRNHDMGYIYPNPADGDATFCFSMGKSEDIEIRLYAANGQLISQQKQYLSTGTHRFLLRFPIAGIYYLSLLKDDKASVFKAVYTGERTQNILVVYKGIEKLNSSDSEKNQTKGATTEKSLAYTENDIIHYNFFSGVNKTLISDVPKSSKTIYVEFVSCIDKENKSYKIVKIGNQFWMAENLAYLPAVYPPNSDSYTESRYYVYGYKGSDAVEAKQQPNYATYGVLYNWYAARAACPPGWHLPTDDEWKQLEMTLGMTKAQSDAYDFRGTNQGTQMKTTSGWYNNGNGTNTSGFSALPGGFLSYFDDFIGIGYYGHWWSSLQVGPDMAWRRYLYYEYSNVYRNYFYKEIGCSVRCVKD
jgi:uncharacterized protein (TIGR02145 family)